MTLFYPHWQPSEIKAMSPRERRYWTAMAEWVVERRRSGSMMHSGPGR